MQVPLRLPGASDSLWPWRLALLLIWAATSFGTMYFAHDLSMLVAGWPVNYWIASQGGVLVFIAIVATYARVANRADAAAARASSMPS